MRVYLDNCVFNRPFDDQSNIRVKIETEAIEFILSQIANGLLEIVWSSVLALENEANPTNERREWVFGWKELAVVTIEASENILEESQGLLEFGFKPVDALHIAAARAGAADYFLTTDDGILKRSNFCKAMSIIGPVEFLKVIGE